MQRFRGVKLITIRIDYYTTQAQTATVTAVKEKRKLEGHTERRRMNNFTNQRVLHLDCVTVDIILYHFKCVRYKMKCGLSQCVTGIFLFLLLKVVCI